MGQLLDRLFERAFYRGREGYGETVELACDQRFADLLRHVSAGVEDRENLDSGGEAKNGVGGFTSSGHTNGPPSM